MVAGSAEVGRGTGAMSVVWRIRGATERGMVVSMSNEKRFEVTYEQKKGIAEVFRILRDTQTGVCYLQTWSGASGGITPLLDADGRPVIQR